MAERADAHIHLFERSFGASFTARPGVVIDEVACYASLMADHGVAAALVIGYEGEQWCGNNNAFLATAAQQHDWVHPAAFVDLTRPLTVSDLERWRRQRFVGVVFYVFTDEQQRAVAAIGDEVWTWLVDHHWLVSVNSRGACWARWRCLLDRFGELRLLVSHLGLPPRVSEQPKQPDALADVLDLARYPGPRVKLSGFYAATKPGCDYPHEAAWPYVQWLREAYGAPRLLWGSDFSPCLDWLTFPQTFDLFRHMPFLSNDERRAIEGTNLLRLLAESSQAV